jgi:hypothetical protein
MAVVVEQERAITRPEQWPLGLVDRVVAAMAGAMLRAMTGLTALVAAVVRLGETWAPHPARAATALSLSKSATSSRCKCYSVS